MLALQVEGRCSLRTQLNRQHTAQAIQDTLVLALQLEGSCSLRLA